jgi:gliding motility-associated-like protein
VRLVNDLTTCFSIGSFDLVLQGPPGFTEVPVFALCDDLIEDGFTEFDLNTQNATIVAGNTDLSVTYYGTQADADLAQSPLLSPYTNTVNPEIIYVRVDDNVEGCYGVFEMELQVISPIAIVPDPLEYCDPDNDGFGEFTLTDADSQITGGNPSGNLQVTYHYLLEDAQNGVNPLASPYLNDVPFTQIVYVRLLDESTGCYGTTTLELIVLPSPQIIQPSDLALCDQDGDGIEVFDLTVSESELLNGLDPLLYSIAYYQDAGLTIPIVDPTTYANIPPSPQTIYIVVEDIANQCKSQTILQLWVYLSPVLVPPLPYELCDLITQDDGFESFDLESKTAEITGGDFTISITYHQTQADANTGNNPLLSPYTNTSNPQTIFLRAENTNGGDLNCFSFIGVTLDLVVNPLPSPVTPTPLEVCDQDNNGITQFILTDKDVEIIGGEPGVEISYHETLLDAESGTNPLASPYTNIDTYMQTIYARAEYPIALGGTGCFQIVSLELLVNLSPIISSEIPDLVICDDDGFTVFDLTQRADDIYGSQDPLDYDLSYYISQVDADLATNAIASPTAFTNTANPQTIWVRLEDNPINNPTACFKVGSFELVVELEPVFTPVPIFEQCDDQIQDGFTEFNLNIQNGTITGGDSTLGVTYYANQIDADDAINPLVIPYTNTVNPETIYVRIESTITGCYGTFPMSLLVRPAPMIFEPSALEHCDSGNDGFGEFMLTDSDLEVTGGVPIGNLQVSYHYLLEDAQNDVNPLLSPYLNDIPNLQTVHVRLVDQSTGCYSITTLDLIVLETPQIISPTDMILCDDNADGIEVFDLTLGELELLSIADPAGGPYSITYYEDAELTIAITNPTAYSNIPPSPQTIYIVVEGVSNGCRVETTLLLWVVSSPILLSPTALELCDTTEIIGPDDEFEPFDLESKTDEITGGDPTVGITYHETQLDADTGINSLISPYINISNPQTIFIRAEAQDTQCIVSEAITLSLVVTPLPSPVTPSPLAVCDVDNDGFSFFMLTDKDSEIIAGEPGVVVSYYETLLDAEAGIFALTSPYINIVTPSQIIYARAEYSIALGGTGCFRIVDLELIVNPSPIVPLDIPDLVICDDDGFTVFDLTQREGDIYGSQDPLDYTLSYHTSQADAIAGTNPIANPAAFPNTINPQIIWVRLEDNTTVCFKVGSFEIRSELGPLVIQPTPFTSCDDLGAPNDGVTLFDLTLKTTEITGGASGVTVQYYESQVDAELDTNVIDPDTAYQNTSNPQTIWLRVSDVNTLCFDTTVYLTLRVVANPAPEDPDPIILCDVNNPGDGEEVFDLTIREPQILDGETWDVSYYNTYQDAVDDNAPIVLPTAYSNVINPEIVYVRVSIDLLDTTACFEIVELTLMVSSLPDDTAVITPYIICEIPGDGESIFDLTTKIDEILNGQDPTIFQVLFYESQAEADLMINEIQNPVIYANTSNPQRIYVVILNIDTDCFVSTQSFDIEEREGAIANIPLDPYAICDYWDENDGIAEFDLLDQDLLDEILGTQDPLVYQLDFYGTLENAELEVSPLPATYVNIINPQIIYARVTNINTECYDLTEVILKVELIPELALDDFYRLCVDSLGNPIPAGNTSPPVIDTGLDPSIYMFEWQLNSEVLLGEIGASITVLQEGIYTVRVTEILTGCMSMATTTVITSSPPLNYSAEVTNAFASEHTITATTDGTGDYEFQLDDNPFQESGIFLDVEPGSHVITIKDVSGCGASVTISVGVIDYPQFMTPNEDGYHDTWNIIGIANGDPTAKIYIFDRYGKLLKQLSIFSEGWDGSYNGKPMPSSDYWFRVEYTENAAKKIFKGHFTLKR